MHPTFDPALSPRDAERYRSFFENTTEAIWRVDLAEPLDPAMTEDAQIDHIFQHAILTEANAAFARLYGREDPADFIGMALEVIMPRSEPRNEEYLRRAIRAGYRVYDEPSVERGFDDRVIHLLNNFVAPIDDDGRVRGAWGTSRDVTAQVGAEAALRESEARFRALVEASAQIVWSTDATGRVIDPSPSWALFTGQPDHAYIGEGFWETIHPGDRERVAALWAESIATRARYESDYRLWHAATQTFRWVSARGTALLNEDGTVRGWVGMNFDIHERRTLEQNQRLLGELNQRVRTLREPEAILDAVMNLAVEHFAVSRCVYAEAEEDGEHIVVLRECCHGVRSVLGRHRLGAFGLSVEAALRRGETVVFSDSAADPEGLSPSEQAAYEGIEGVASVAVPLLKEGRLVAAFGLQHRERRAWTREEIFLCEQIAELSWSAIDNLLAQTALRASDGLKTSIIQSSLDGLILMDHLGMIIDWNPAAEGIFGRSRAAVLGHSLAEIAVPVYLRDAHRRGLSLYVASRQARILGKRYELPALRADGSEFPCEISISHVPGTEPPLFAGYVRDISDRKFTEARTHFLLLLTNSLRPLNDPGEITATTARLLGEHLGADRCAYAEVEADEDHINIMGDYTAPGVESIVGRFSMADFGDEPLRLHRAGLVLAVADVEAAPHHAAHLAAWRAAGIRALISVPLVKEGRFAGKLAVHQRAPRDWTPAQVELVGLVANLCWESVERSRVTRRLLEAAERFQALVEATPQKIFTAAPDGCIDYINPRWTEFSGLTLDQIRGCNWTSFIHPDDVAENVRLWNHSVSTGERFYFEHRFPRADGTWRWHVTHAQAVRDNDGRIRQWIGSNNDVDDLRRAREQAESASSAKDSFLAALSHELRTPLNPVLLLAAAREGDSALADEVRDDFALIRRNVELEARLIDDLLDLTRISRGKLSLRLGPVDLREALRHTWSIVEPEAAAKGVNFACHLGDEPRWVEADAARIQQVFWNLLKNAVKFTPAGGHVSLTLAITRPGFAHVQVRDTGIGIDPRYLTTIFDAFSQGALPMQHRFGGLGLGLAISKAITQLHRGHLTVDSAGLDKGATFTLELQSVAAPGTSAPLPESARPAATALRVLLVEDHEATLSVLSRLLRKAGHEVATAPTLQAALGLTEKEPEFDVLVSDLGLPDGSGLDLLPLLRKQYPTLRGIALSGYGMEEDLQRSKQAGYAAHLTKPVDLNQLLVMLNDEQAAR